MCFHNDKKKRLSSKHDDCTNWHVYIFTVVEGSIIKSGRVVTTLTGLSTTYLCVSRQDLDFHYKYLFCLCVQLFVMRGSCSFW